MIHEIEQAAVQQNGLALMCASDELRDDPKNRVGGGSARLGMRASIHFG